MLRTTALVLSVVIGLAVSGSALSVTVGGMGAYGAFEHINTLIDTFSQDHAVNLPSLHTGLGVACDVGLWSPFDRVNVGVGLLALGARTGARDASVRTSLIGLYGWAGYELGRLQVSLGLGGSRGTFSSESLIPFGDVSGMGGGLVGRIRYRVLHMGALDVGATVSVQWLPIQEMKDARGQVYRGRGTPFMDFSGISVSMDVQWQSRKGATPS